MFGLLCSSIRTTVGLLNSSINLEANSPVNPSFTSFPKTIIIELLLSSIFSLSFIKSETICFLDRLTLLIQSEVLLINSVSEKLTKYRTISNKCESLTILPMAFIFGATVIEISLSVIGPYSFLINKQIFLYLFLFKEAIPSLAIILFLSFRGIKSLIVEIIPSTNKYSSVKPRYASLKKKAKLPADILIFEKLLIIG